MYRVFADRWGARFSYAPGERRGNTNGTPTATDDFQVLDQRNLDLNEGPTHGAGEFRSSAVSTPIFSRGGA